MAIFYPTLDIIQELNITQDEKEVLDILKELDNNYEIFFHPSFTMAMPFCVIIKENSFILIVDIIKNKNSEYISSTTKIKQALNLVLPYSKIEFDILQSILILQGKLLTRDTNNLFIPSQLTLVEYIKTIEKTRYEELKIFRKIKELIIPPKELLNLSKIIHLDNKQEKLSKVSFPEIKKIQGNTGSGKTFILSKKAINLNEVNKQEVLIITFNITLINKIKQYLYYHSKSKDIYMFKVFHFHGFLKVLATELGIDTSIYYIKSSSIHTATRNIILDCIKKIKENNNYTKYKNILLDEVQDFSKEWIDFIKEYIFNKDGNLTLFADPKQNLYSKLQSKEKRVYTGIQGKWNILSINYRNHTKIIKFLRLFQKEFFEKEYHMDKYSLDINGNLFDESSIYMFNSNEINFQKIQSKIKELVKNNIALDDITILAQNNKDVERLSKYLEINLKLPITYTQNNKYSKLLFKPLSDTLKITTIQSFKGYESEVIIILLGDTWFNKYAIYTALSRANKMLIIFNQSKIFYDFLVKIKDKTRFIKCEGKIDE